MICKQRALGLKVGPVGAKVGLTVGDRVNGLEVGDAERVADGITLGVSLARAEDGLSVGTRVDGLKVGNAERVADGITLGLALG